MRMMKKRRFSGTMDPQITDREIQNRKLARKAAAEVLQSSHLQFLFLFAHLYLTN